MKCSSWSLFPCILTLLFGSAFRSTPDVVNLSGGVAWIKYDGGFQTPARRNLLSDAKERIDTALVADLDGMIYLFEVGSRKPLWSFSSGPEIYSSYQAPENKLSGIKSYYYIDCGHDWKLYAHNGRGELKLIPSLEEYISSTPQIAEDGGIVLGSKETTAFLVDAKTGRIINNYSSSDSPTAMQSSAGDFIYNASVRKQYLSGSGLKSDELPLYITRTDYRLVSYTPNSNEVLWNLTVSEIGSAYLCQDEEMSLGGNLLDSESFDIQYKMPLSCQSRAQVYRLRNNSVLQHLSVLNGKPKILHQDMTLPTSTFDDLPSQPNVQKLLELFPLSDGNDKFVDVNDRQNLKDVFPLHAFERKNEIPCKKDEKETSNYGFLTRNGSFGTSHLYFLVTLLTFAAYRCNFISLIKVKWMKRSTCTTAINANSRRKKPRKIVKGGSDNGKQDEGNEDKYTFDRSDITFWQKLNQPFSIRTTGRTIGKLVVFNREIAKGSNGTIVLEGIHEGRQVAVKRLVRDFNDIAFKEIQNFIISDRHPNVIRWYGVEQDQDFVYLALERCSCNLNDLILMYMKSSSDSIVGSNLDIDIATIHFGSMDGFNKDYELWMADGYPSPLMLKLMRDIISGVDHLHDLGIVHRDLKPQNVLIVNDRSLCAKLSDMGISKRLVGDMSSWSYHATGCGSSGWQAPEQLLHGRQTMAVDLFSLGCVLFFCITGGSHPFGNHLERDINITRSKIDLFQVEHIPEALDLIMQLLNPTPEMRPKASEVLCHPLLWNAEMRLSFLRDSSDRVELEDRNINSNLFSALEYTAPVALGLKWNDKLEPAFLNDIGRYRRYRFDSVRDLLRVMRNKLNHFRELPLQIQELIGPVPEGFDMYFRSRFPKLLIEVYKVMVRFCCKEEWFSKYIIPSA